ncbi:MAG TPA: DUF3147 family protein [Kofleriaceae bacterium]|nr:DUF3147 family protein [Kofleriaceae bacterium]
MELLVRFLLGGIVVSAFAAIGELFKPKTFSGLFGAAPSVAIASLGLAFHKHGADYVRTQAKAMLLGSVAMLLYCTLCVAIAKRKQVPIWLGAGLSWIAWFAAAFALFALVRSGGVA